MKVFLFKWQSGDVSVVAAKNEASARMALSSVKRGFKDIVVEEADDFVAHFKKVGVTNRGDALIPDYELESFGEDFERQLYGELD